MTFKEYLKQHLDCSVEDLTTPEDEIMQRLKNKSLETINRNLDIFLNIICLSKTRLANNWFVLYNEPERTLELLYKVKQIAHVDMKTILHVCPKIACMDAENAETIVKYIEAENIPIKYALKVLDLFTLSAETVRARLEEIKNEEFFRLNIKNPKILQVVHFLIKAKKRLTILEELRVNPTLSSLTGDQDFFEKYCETGIRPSNSDALHYINAELNIDKTQFIRIMKKHRRWTYVPIIHVGRNLQTLRERFSDEEIKKYIYILFYYSGKLNRELEALEYHDGLEDFKEDGSVKKEFVLPLVLYYLERESNFTGESIWDPEEQNPYEDLPDMPVNFASHLNGANRL